MDIKIENSWTKFLNSEFEMEYFQKLIQFIDNEYTSGVCFPPQQQIFNAFNFCELKNTKVVILGQDPYHGIGQANGLAFSVNEGISFPPSLRNIFKELKNDLDIDIPFSGNLEKWASQGVLLLNAILTVRGNQAGSHQKQGWETFTDAVISILNKEKQNLVFMLWGAYAHKKGKNIDENKHLVLKCKHPSPLSANQGGWFDQKQFSSANAYLEKKHLAPIIW
jgi:uracil-DNA glycosylase